MQAQYPSPRSDVKYIVCFDTGTLTWGSVAHNWDCACFAAQKCPMRVEVNTPNLDLGLPFRRLSPPQTVCRCIRQSYSMTTLSGRWRSEGRAEPRRKDRLLIAPGNCDRAT